MNRLCKFLFLLLVICSCEETEKEKITRLVSEWEGKVIAFPSYSICDFTVQIADTVEFPFSHLDYKIVVYADSIGSISDELQLTRWKRFMDEVESYTDSNVLFVFYFNTTDTSKLRYLTLRDQFTYPICIDKKDVFNNLNQFSNEFHIQTFLLDANDRVLTLGDPIKYPEAKKRYWEILSSSEY